MLLEHVSLLVTDADQHELDAFDVIMTILTFWLR
jgi:hypothetical protein